MFPSQRRLAGIGLMAVAVVLLAGLWWWTGASHTSPPRESGGLPVVALADLPVEARDTLALIEAGGPFPYSRDGVVFQNREHALPARATGWYHEYTVPTPGEADRGARRIVTGRDGQQYWTDDHYDTFSVIQEEP